ncbi:MAG: acetylornithine transaminase [Candidatus Thermoplasmatota archaeon]
MDLRARWESTLAHTYGTPSLLLERGEGVHVWDDHGKRYLDFIAGLAVSSTGHAHPRVVAAVREQAGKLFHVSNLYATENVLHLAERLTELTGFNKAFFCNSGAEANELALKTVRRHAHAMGKPESVVIALENSFHGRTTATVALTGQPKYQKDFGPFPGGIVHVPANDAVALEVAFASHAVSGVFLEFVQGEGGVLPLRPDFVAAAACLCRENDAFLVADEVQTGVARTGRFLASEWYGVKPDITTLAKGLASGVPIGAVVFNERAASLLHPGDHGCTFGGNPLSAAAALATLDVIEDEGLGYNAWEMGGRLRVGAMERIPGVSEVRGLGLLNGIVLDEPIAKRVKADAEAAGLLVNAIGEHVLRLAPPLIVNAEQVDEAMSLLAKAVER